MWRGQRQRSCGEEKKYIKHKNFITGFVKKYKNLKENFLKTLETFFFLNMCILDQPIRLVRIKLNPLIKKTERERKKNKKKNR